MYLETYNIRAITILWSWLTISSLGKMLGKNLCRFLQNSQIFWYWIASSKGKQWSNAMLFIDLVHLLVLEYKSNEEMRKFMGLSPRMCLMLAVCLIHAAVNSRQNQLHAGGIWHNATFPFSREKSCGILGKVHVYSLVPYIFAKIITGRRFF